MASPIDLRAVQARLVAIAADGGAASGACGALGESLRKLGAFVDTPSGARLLTPSEVAAIADIEPRLTWFAELVKSLREAAESVAQAAKEIEERIPRAN